MKKYLSLSVLSLIVIGIGFALYWNFFIYLPKNLKIQSVLKTGDVSVSQYIQQIDDALSFYPTLGNEAALVAIYPVVEKYITSGTSEVSSRKLIAILEKHTNEWRGYKTRILLDLGRIYAIMYLKYQKTEYFEAADKYYNLALNERSDEGDSLYGLYCIYKIRGDTEKANTIKDHIRSTWGLPELEINCQI